jgi:hypothetical protein
MPVTITTDEEADRTLSLRVSNRVPLPPEIALCDPMDARSYFRWITYYEVFGLSEHPVVDLLGKRKIQSAMASAISHADHLDRVSHYDAWLGNETVKITDLTRPGKGVANNRSPSLPTDIAPKEEPRD